MSFATFVMDLLGMLLKAAMATSENPTPEQLEVERQALILAQRRIQEEIARRELPP
jgi:hypothetical protein